MKYENMVLWERLVSETVGSTLEKTMIVDDVFALLQKAYAQVKGGLHFPDKDTLVSSTAQWRVIYLDEEIVGVVIYKAKRGLKMVAMGISSEITYTLRDYVKRMLTDIFQMTFGKTWMEVSEGAERFLLKIGGERFVISNNYAKVLTEKEIISLDNDGKHYYREINGVLKRKMIIGTIRHKNIFTDERREAKV